MKKIKFIMPTVLALTAASPMIMLTSCKENNDIESQLKSMPNVIKVEKMSDLPSYQARYMIYFNHPLDWTNSKAGYFTQRVEFDFRGKDRVNQLFTCGYELRNEKPDRMNDYEIANHFQGNIIKPEYRFFDKSRPEHLNNDTLENWDYLTNQQASDDFHSIITSFKTILTGKWAFSGTSKGGETTNYFAMTHMNDCDVYVPYVAPIFYEPGSSLARKFQENIYGTKATNGIGYSVLGEQVANEYHKAVADFQYYALANRNTTITSEGKTLCNFFWDKYDLTKYRDFVKNNKDIVFDMCVCESGTAFWQYRQNITQLKNFIAMPEGDDKLKACCEIIQDLNDPTGWQTDSLFFPYYVQAKKEMGEYTYDFKEMVKAIASWENKTESEVDALLAATSDKRTDLLWNCLFTAAQKEAWTFNKQGRTQLIGWWNVCPSKVFMIYGGVDTWTALGFNKDNCEGMDHSENIKIYYGNDVSNAYGRTHYTRISTLDPTTQKEIWPQLEAILLPK